MMSERIHLPRNRITIAWADEARAMGVSLPILLTADLARLREVLHSAAPKLTGWEWGLVSHVMDDEAVQLLTDRESGERIMGAAKLSAAIQEWADTASDEEMLRAEKLARHALAWTDIERWALMVRGRI